MTASYTTAPRLDDPDVFRVEVDGAHATGVVLDGFDVFSIPHGGYLLALAASAVLGVTGAPDVFTITAHYLRKAEHAPITFEVADVGGSRRFHTVHAVGRQGDTPVLSVMASVGDRGTIEGPAWTDRPAPKPGPLSPRAGNEGLPFQPPAIAERSALRLQADDVAFARGELRESARISGVMELEHPDVLAALVACDVTPPVVWNALGARGWVPTVELTAHVRARPALGPLRVVAETHHVADGFLEEDALVHDSSGRLVVQSRQLARWTSG